MKQLIKSLADSIAVFALMLWDGFAAPLRPDEEVAQD